MRSTDKPEPAPALGPAKPRAAPTPTEAPKDAWRAIAGRPGYVRNDATGAVRPEIS